MLCLPISRNNVSDGVLAMLLVCKQDSYVSVLDGPLGLCDVQSLCIAGEQLAGAVVSCCLAYMLGWWDARLSHAFLILRWVWQGCCFPLSSQNPPKRGWFGYPWCILAVFLAIAVGNNPVLHPSSDMKPWNVKFPPLTFQSLWIWVIRMSYNGLVMNVTLTCRLVWNRASPITL